MDSVDFASTLAGPIAPEVHHHPRHSVHSLESILQYTVCMCMCVRTRVWVCVRMCACVYVWREGRNNTSG